MRLAETRAALRRNLSGADAAWTNELIDGAVARAIDDLDRILPREVISDHTMIFAITGEVWASGTIGTTVTLANKRIKPESETVKNEAGDTTYVRDTDYTMDYVAGTIATISGGSIVADTNHQIDYTILEVYVDLSSLTGLIRISRVEYPGGQVPAEFQAYYTWGDFLVLTSFGVETQQRMAANKHVWVYYHAKHTTPDKDTDGTWKPQLDEVVLKGAGGYCLITKALELRHSARTRQTSGVTALGELAAIATQIDTALTNTQTQASSASSDLEAIDGKLDDMVAALAASSGFLASAGDALVLAEAQAVSAASDISAIDTPLSDADAELGKVDSFLTTQVTDRLDNARSFVSGATTQLDLALLELKKVEPSLVRSVDKIPDVDTARTAVRAALLLGAAKIAETDHYVRAAPDAVLGVLNANVNSPITNVSSNITAAGNQLISAVAQTDTVNIGELVSEMHRRYADSWAAIGRLEYDAWLTWFGRVDRFLAQGSGVLALAGEYRANADGYLGEANTILGEITAALGSAAGYQANAAQYGEVARGQVAQGQTLVNAANVGLGTARGVLDAADGYISVAGVRLNAARTSSDLVNAYIAVASQYVNMAQAKIAEGEALRTPVDAILERASMKVEIARVYQQESDRRLQELGLKQQEADRYVAIAASESELADKFDVAGTRELMAFVAILTDRSQVRAETGLSPTRQEAPGR